MKVQPHEKEKIDSDTGEIKKVNANFFQVYKDNVDLLIEIGKENKTALNIFLWICKRMDNKNALVVSQHAIAESLDITVRTVQYSIAFLKKIKALEVLKTGNSNVYVLNSNIVWQDEAGMKKYAHFTAKVYLSASEQENNYKRISFPHIVKKSKPSKKDFNKLVDDFESK